MIAFAAGLLLGVSGSVHCAAMCGPLVAVADGAATRQRGLARWRARATYHGGRIGVYVLLGAAAGASGAAIRGSWLRPWPGRRRWARSGGAGLHRGRSRSGGIGRAASSRLAGVVSRAAGWLRRHGLAHPSMMGTLNGLLPCGLVYAALIAASGTGDVAAAVSLMVGFGLGTLPALLGIGVASALVSARGGPGVRRIAVAVALGVAGMALIARGLEPATHDHAGTASPGAAAPAPSPAAGHAHH